MNPTPEIIFECLECRSSFGLKLDTTNSSKGDIMCPLCDCNRFMAVSRMYEKEPEADE